MEYQEDVKGISPMIDQINNGYQFPEKLNDEEFLEGVTFLNKKTSGLSSDIIVDTGETYKEFKHPLAVFVVNGDDVIPVIVSTTPQVISKDKQVSHDILKFVSDNVKLLTDVANIDISGVAFYDECCRNTHSL